MENSEKSAEKKSDPLPKTILGRYNVIEKLGEGTYGKVYKVYDPQTDQVVIFSIRSMQSSISRLSKITTHLDSRLPLCARSPLSNVSNTRTLWIW